MVDLSGGGSAGNSLVVKLSETLREAIYDGRIAAGEKLPSEARLTETHGVSRTVIREAIAALRADGLVESRRGAGVFVLPPDARSTRPFQDMDPARISSIIEVVELRVAVEVEMAALAALRRSPAQEEAIIEWHRAIKRCRELGEPTAPADFALHKAIADATNNRRFSEFLDMIGPGAIPRASFSQPTEPEYLDQIHREHEKIVAAISAGEPETARAAMREHLTSSLKRYRAILQRSM